jgi:hypothetical protein
MVNSRLRNAATEGRTPVMERPEIDQASFSP